MIKKVYHIMRTNNSNLLSKFFLEVLGNESQQDNDDLLIEGEDYAFKLRQEGTSLKEEFEIQVEDIEELKKKIEFFNFRQSDFFVEINEQASFVEVIDFEGRKWHFVSL